MMLYVGKKSFPVASLEEASRVYDGYRADRASSQMPHGVIQEDDGTPVAYVSYNAKVWARSPRDWQVGDVPLYNPYVA